MEGQNQIRASKPKQRFRVRVLKPQFSSITTNSDKDIEHDRLVSWLNFEREATNQSYTLISKNEDLKEKKLQCYKSKLEELQTRFKEKSQKDMILYFRQKLQDGKTNSEITQARQLTYNPKVYKQYGELIPIKVLKDKPEIALKVNKCYANSCRIQECKLKPVRLNASKKFDPKEILLQQIDCESVASLGAAGGKPRRKQK